MVDMIENFQRVLISWDGLPEKTLLDDAMAVNTQAAGAGELRGHFIFTRKTTTLSDLLTLLNTAIGAQSLLEKEPVLGIVIAATLLAAILPMDLHILDDLAGKTLGIIKKASRQNVIDAEAVKALMQNESLAEEIIQKLAEFGFLRFANNGDLIIQRKILANIRISLGTGQDTDHN